MPENNPAPEVSGVPPSSSAAPMPTDLFQQPIGEPAASELTSDDTEVPLTARADVSSRLPAQRKIPRSIWGLVFLIPYALAATFGVIYLWQQHFHIPTHVLESLPDQGLYEDFLDGRRRETIAPVSKAGEKPLNQKTISPNEIIPAEIPPVFLGQTRRIGALAVTPLEITLQQLRFAYKQGQNHILGGKALVLKLQVRNEGSLIFHPDDETFNRALLDDVRMPIYTYLEVGKQHFYGAVADPATERLDFPLCPALLPDETGILYVTACRTVDGKNSLSAALAQFHGPLLWRVHLRRGREEITLANGRRRQVWMTAVVPVQFNLQDIDKRPSQESH
jgi:hypothetical protein